jgi:endonuclease/exonuclease/phosphatase family metal-dependent hydrolase
VPGDTYDLMWTTNGFTTDGMVFTNKSSTAFNLEIAPKDGGEVLRLAMPVAGVNPLRLFSYNIHHGEGEDNVIDLDRTGDVVAAADPDLVALQEVDKNTSRSGYVDQAKELAQRLGMEYRFMKNLDYQGGEYGIALLSRYPIQATYLHPLPANGGEPRGALEVVVEVPDLYGRTNTLSFISLHLDHLGDSSRVSQVQTLLADLAPRSQPIILAGDFNALPSEGSIALLESNGYDPLDPAGAFTYPSPAPTKKIDYIMAKGLAVSESTFEVVAETMASDHRPLLAETFLGATAGWLDGYGLEASLMENFADPDGDGMDNYSEWLTGTDPTNALSFFGIQPSGSGAVPTGFRLRWNSIAERTYRVEVGTNLVDGTFQTLESGIQGLEGATEFIDTSATGKAQAYYRVFVE